MAINQSSSRYRLSVGLVLFWGFLCMGAFSNIDSSMGYQPLEFVDSKYQSPATGPRQKLSRRPKASQRLELWTVKRSPFDSLIKQVANQYGLEPALIKAMVQAESAFDPHAESPSGAKGLMQVLPDTAADFDVEDLDDPYQNLKAGVQYLKYLLKRFSDDETLALAAYNAGITRVKRYQGVPPYSETRSYLRKVLGLRNIYASQWGSS